MSLWNKQPRYVIPRYIDVVVDEDGNPLEQPHSRDEIDRRIAAKLDMVRRNPEMMKEETMFGAGF